MRRGLRRCIKVFYSGSGRAEDARGSDARGVLGEFSCVRVERGARGGVRFICERAMYFHYPGGIAGGSQTLGYTEAEAPFVP